MSKPPKDSRPRRMSGGKPTAPKRSRRTPKAEKDNATRMMHKKVKTARGRKISSKLWIERQINDPFVREAQIKGYRSRAAFKLEELDDKFNLLKHDSLVVDLGCAPGGWVQIALKRGAKRVVGIDILPVDMVAGADLIEYDFMADDAPDKIKSYLEASPDVVLSDLAANTTGHKQTDHLKTVALVEAAADFAMRTLRPGGHFASKVFQGGAESGLLKELKSRFQTVKHFKPESSRKGSPEIYLVALNLQNPKTD
jgi:23S rRNA (uridine2552-2'-O)-methyltransferase